MRGVRLHALVVAVVFLAAACDCGGEPGPGSGDLALESITPARGPIAGGTAFEVRGAGFAEELQITFGDAAVADLEILTTELARGTTPPHAAGTVDVRALDARGDVATLSAAFTYLAGPAITAMDPAFGPVEGGTRVTISGSSFVDGAQMWLGMAEATEVFFTDAMSISARAPAG